MVFTSMKDLPGSWQPWILRATASGSNLTIKVPAQIYGKGRCKPVACLPQGIHASLTMLRFTTTPAGAGSDALVRSGSCTAGRFKVSSKFTYTDRSTARVTSSSRCSA
jgi:hypothetical protein